MSSKFTPQSRLRPDWRARLATFQRFRKNDSSPLDADNYG